MGTSNACIRASLRFFLLLGAAPACTADVLPSQPVVRRDETSPPVVDAGTVVLTPETFTIVGTLASAARTAERIVTVVDGRGRRSRVLTDENGSFTVPDVMAPYDLAVAPSPGDPRVVYRAIWRADPVVDLFEQVTPASAKSLPLRLSLRLGPSPCARASGWVTVVTASTAGQGSTVVRCASGAKTKTVDLEHILSGTPTTDQDVDVHVLVESDDATTFAYGHREVTLTQRNDRFDLGAIEPAHIPVAVAPSVRGGGDVGILPDWTWMTAVTLDVGGDAGGFPQTLFTSVAAGTAAERALPLVPGATLRVSLLGRHPKADGRSDFFRATEAWSGAVAVPSQTITIDATVGPDVIHPREGDHLPRNAVSFTWAPPQGSAVTAILSVMDVARGEPVLRVVTAEPEVARERLEALGVPTLDAGEHWLELAAWPAVSVDDMTSPEITTRTARFDRSRPGKATLLRIPFVVD